MSQSTCPRLLVEAVNDVMVAGFSDEALLSDEVIREVEDQLNQLVESVGPGKLLISFRGVKYLSSTMLAVLIKTARRVQKAHGRLILCNIAPHLMEVFRAGRFDRLFEIHDIEASALDAFEGHRGQPAT
jgi:anti-anti-sigma factor